MRNYCSIIALCGLLFLVGCGQQQEYIAVQGFSFLANTIISSNTGTSAMHYVVENNKTMSGDFLTVLYQTIDSGADSNARATSNIYKLQQSYPSIGITAQSPITFSCQDEDIEGALVLGSLSTDPEKDPLYFVQHFFIHKGVGYVFTYSSSDQKSTVTMGDNWQDMRCSS